MLSAHGREALAARFGPEAYLLRLRRLLAATSDPAALGELVTERRGDPVLMLRAARKRLLYHGPRQWRAFNDIKLVRRARRKVGKFLRRR